MYSVATVAISDLYIYDSVLYGLQKERNNVVIFVGNISEKLFRKLFIFGYKALWWFSADQIMCRFKKLSVLENFGFWSVSGGNRKLGDRKTWSKRNCSYSYAASELLWQTPCFLLLYVYEIPFKFHFSSHIFVVYHQNGLKYICIEQTQILGMPHFSHFTSPNLRLRHLWYGKMLFVSLASIKAPQILCKYGS